jgi:hypothetical protein
MHIPQQTAATTKIPIINFNIILSPNYLFNSRGDRGGFGVCSFFSPVSDIISLMAPMLESIDDVSIGIKMTLEFWVRVISRSDSI